MIEVAIEVSVKCCELKMSQLSRHAQATIDRKCDQNDLVDHWMCHKLIHVDNICVHINDYQLRLDRLFHLALVLLFLGG